VLEVARKGGVRRLARLARSALALRRGRALPAPLFATLAVTYRCNYACGMCDFPARAEQEFPAREKLCALIDELAARGTLAVGITGGEPMLRRDLPELVAHAVSRGLLCHVNTNGSCLTAERSAALLAARPCSLNVSLDGAQAETHDRLRGVPGSFAQIRRDVRALMALRDRTRARSAVRLVMALGADNAREVEDFAALGAELGVDGVGFLPVHTLAGEARTTLAPEAHADLAARLARLRRGPHARLLDNSSRYLAGALEFLGGEAMPARCSAPLGHVAIDPWFRAYPCVPLMTLDQARRDERAIFAPHAERPAPPVEVCTRCWWNCHRELDVALGLLGT
jgi:MoaA/NifB/PqqE/SkfB family radical SAM enzyme